MGRRSSFALDKLAITSKERRTDWVRWLLTVCAPPDCNYPADEPLWVTVVLDRIMSYRS